MSNNMQSYDLTTRRLDWNKCRFVANRPDGGVILKIGLCYYEQYHQWLTRYGRAYRRPVISVPGAFHRGTTFPCGNLVYTTFSCAGICRHDSVCCSMITDTERRAEARPIVKPADIMALSSGTIGHILHTADYETIDKVQAEFTLFVAARPVFTSWPDAWKAFQNAQGGIL